MPVRAAVLTRFDDDGAHILAVVPTDNFDVAVRVLSKEYPILKEPCHRGFQYPESDYNWRYDEGTLSLDFVKVFAP